MYLANYLENYLIRIDQFQDVRELILKLTPHFFNYYINISFLKFLTLCNISEQISIMQV